MCCAEKFKTVLEILSKCTVIYYKLDIHDTLCYKKVNDFESGSVLDRNVPINYRLALTMNSVKGEK